MDRRSELNLHIIEDDNNGSAIDDKNLTIAIRIEMVVVRRHVGVVTPTPPGKVGDKERRVEVDVEVVQEA